MICPLPFLWWAEILLNVPPAGHNKSPVPPDSTCDDENLSSRPPLMPGFATEGFLSFWEAQKAEGALLLPSTSKIYRQELEKETLGNLNIFTLESVILYLLTWFPASHLHMLLETPSLWINSKQAECFQFFKSVKHTSRPLSSAPQWNAPGRFLQKVSLCWHLGTIQSKSRLTETKSNSAWPSVAPSAPETPDSAWRSQKSINYTINVSSAQLVPNERPKRVCLVSFTSGKHCQVTMLS